MILHRLYKEKYGTFITKPLSNDEADCLRPPRRISVSDG